MGEGFMMAILMARPGGKAPWVRWLTLPVEGDAMCDTAAHFADSWTRKVFEPKEAGGYGLEPASELLAAGLVAQGHFCCEGDNGEWRWMESVEEAANKQGFEVNKLTVSIAFCKVHCGSYVILCYMISDHIKLYIKAIYSEITYYFGVHVFTFF